MKRCFFIAVLLALSLVSPAVTQGPPLTYQLDAPKFDAEFVPVCLPLSLAKDSAFAKIASIQVAGEKAVAGQFTAPSLATESIPAGKNEVRRDLHFILPKAAAGKSLTVNIVLDVIPEGFVSRGLAWRDKPGVHADIVLFEGNNERPVSRYMYTTFDESTKDKRDLTYKVFHHLFDFDGKSLLTNGGPKGLYPHHRGLMFAFNKCSYGEGLKKKADVWHCTGDAHVTHEKHLQIEQGPVLARHRALIHWHGQGKEVFAAEEREVTFYNVPGGTLVDFSSRVKTTGGKVRLDGDPQHAGFHFRAHNDVSEKAAAKQTYYLRPDGKGKPGETRNWPGQKQHVNLPWDAMSFVLNGKRYTTAYLDSPTNPRESRFSERDYGRFGCYFEYDLTPEQPLLVNYRVWVQPGELTGERMANLSQQFTAPIVLKR